MHVLQASEENIAADMVAACSSRSPFARTPTIMRPVDIWKTGVGGKGGQGGIAMVCAGSSCSCE